MAQQVGEEIIAILPSEDTTPLGTNTATSTKIDSTDCPLSHLIPIAPIRKIEELNENSNHQMKFVIISDTHGAHDNLKLPDGDVLVHCGDFTNKGMFGEVNSFFEYLRDECDGKFKYIIVIVGNHEWSPDLIVNRQFCKYFRNSERKTKSEIHLLLDDTVIIKDHVGNDIKIHGTRFRSKWKFPPFMRDSLRKTNFEIPQDIDILLSHFPSDKGKLDVSQRASTELTQLINSDHFTKLKIHCFGHVHASRGSFYEKETDRLFVNAVSIVGDKKKKKVTKPFVFHF